MTLPELPFRQRARVASLDDSQDESLTLTLMELGLVPGTPVRVMRSAPFGDPLEVEVWGSRLAIRRAAAAAVIVEPEAQ